MKCVQIQFPRECTEDIITYRNTECFKRVIQNCCDEMLGDRSVFVYHCTENSDTRTHLWKCGHCQAFLLYGQEEKKGFVLKDLLSRHAHPLRLFQNCNQQLFDQRVKPKKLSIPHEFFTPYKIIVLQQVQAIKTMLKSQWQKKHPHRPIPRLQSILLQNNLYLTCKQFRQRQKPKCPFKIVYRKLKNSPYLYQLQSEEIQLHHKHLLTYFKQDGMEDGDVKGREVREKKEEDQGRFKEYVFDCEMDGALQSIFVNLRNFIQEAKRMGFQILIPSPEPKDNGKKQQRTTTHLDQDDYFLLTNRTCKFLYRSYGQTLIITRQRFCRVQTTKHSFTLYSFQGFNFKHNSVFYCLGLCQNANKSKIKGMIKFFYQNFQPKQNLIMIPSNDQGLSDALDEIRAEGTGFQIHRFWNNKSSPNRRQFYTNFIEAEIGLIKRWLNKLRKPLNIANLYFAHLKTGLAKPHFFGLVDFPQPIISKPTYNHKPRPRAFPTPIQSIPKAEQIFLPACQQILQKNRTWKIIEREQDLQFQKYYDNKIIKRWRMLMARKPFLALMSEYEKVKECSLGVRKDGYFYFVEHLDYAFVVTKDADTYVWACQCGYWNRTGIPCCHLLRVLLEEKEPIIKAVNKFWVVDQALMSILTPYSSKKPRKHRGRRCSVTKQINF